MVTGVPAADLTIDRLPPAERGDQELPFGLTPDEQRRAGRRRSADGGRHGVDEQATGDEDDLASGAPRRRRRGRGCPPTLSPLPSSPRRSSRRSRSCASGSKPSSTRFSSSWRTSAPSLEEVDRSRYPGTSPIIATTGAPSTVATTVPASTVSPPATMLGHRAGHRRRHRDRGGEPERRGGLVVGGEVELLHLDGAQLHRCLGDGGRVGASRADEIPAARTSDQQNETERRCRRPPHGVVVVVVGWKAAVIERLALVERCFHGRVAVVETEPLDHSRRGIEARAAGPAGPAVCGAATVGRRAAEAGSAAVGTGRDRAVRRGATSSGRAPRGSEGDVVDLQAFVAKAGGEVVQARLDRLAVEATTTGATPQGHPLEEIAAGRLSGLERIRPRIDAGPLPETTAGRVAVGVECRVGHLDTVLAHARCVLEQSVLCVDRRRVVRSRPRGRAQRSDLGRRVLAAAARSGDQGKRQAENGDRLAWW